MNNENLLKVSTESSEFVEKFFCGQRVLVDKKTGKYMRSPGRPANTGRYGIPTVTMRVPLCVVPLVRFLCDRLQTIERCRKNIVSDFKNTSKDFDFNQGLFDMFSHLMDENLNDLENK